MYKGCPIIVIKKVLTVTFFTPKYDDLSLGNGDGYTALDVPSSLKK